MPRAIVHGIVVSLFLAACIPTAPSPHEQRSGDHRPSPKGTVNLIVRDQSTNSNIVFSVRDGEENFTDYGVSHTKEMHLIVVRDDLQHFQHLHPERDSKGIWRAAFLPPTGGTYWRYADFVDTDESPYTIRFDKQYSGDIGTYGIVKNFETMKTVDGYRFAFQSKISDDEVTFAYDIADRRGRPVELEEYLGAKGHSVLISSSGDFVHTHASDESAMPVFATNKPSDDFYRVFTQFQIKGKVVTIDFDWSRS